MPRFPLLLITLSLLAGTALAQKPPASVGIFEGQTDIGTVLHEGAAKYQTETKDYLVSGSGENMWFAADDFHFVWKKISARDVSLTADLSMIGENGNGHRKGVLMFRQSLDTDAAYVDAARHGDGLTSLQFRQTRGGTTSEVESAVSGPTRLRIEKHDDRFYLWIGGQGGDLQFSGGSARVELRDPFYVGIGICAHEKNAVEQVSFRHVELDTHPHFTKATYSTVETVLTSGDARTAYVSSARVTKAAWSADGRSVSFNESGQQKEVPFEPLRTAAPVGTPLVDRQSEYVYSSSPEGQIWRKLVNGTHNEQLTSDDSENVMPRLSPNGDLLLFLSTPKGDKQQRKDGDVELRIMSLADRRLRTLTTFVGEPGSLGERPWSPDGKRIVLVSYQTMQ